MNVFNLKGVNQSGNSCRGLTFFKNGHLYLAYKPMHKPKGSIEEGFLPNELNHFKQNTNTGDVFVEALSGDMRNDDQIIERLYSYVSGEPASHSNPSQESMMYSIATSLEDNQLYVSEVPKEILKKKKLKNVKAIPFQNRPRPTDDDVKDIVEIIPVRYALDESQLIAKVGEHEHSLIKDDEKCHDIHKLPTGGYFPGGFFKEKGALSQCTYTLRQLTTGWLYVYNDIDGSLHEYLVEDSKFTKYQFDANESNKPAEERGKLEPTKKTHIEYKKGDVLYLMFSKIRWSWQLLEAFRRTTDTAKKRRETWATKVTCSTLTERHTGLAVEVIQSVADIGAAGKAIFPLAVPSIVKREVQTEDESHTIDGQPIKPISDYLSPLKFKDTARVVALNDVWSDINDMVSQIGYLSGLLYEYNEEEMAKRGTAKAVASLCSGLAEEDINFPDNVGSDPISRTLYQDRLTDFYEAYNDSINNAYDYKKLSQSNKLLANFKRDYGKDPRDKSFIEWNSRQHSRRREQADAQKAEDFLLSHLNHDKKIIKLIEPRVKELLDCHYKIEADPAFVGADSSIPSSHAALMSWMANSLQVTLPYLDDSQRQKLRESLFVKTESDSLISLTFYAFNPEFRSHFQGLINQLPEDKPLSEELSEKNGSLSRQDVVALQININGRLQDIVGLLSSLELVENKWVGGLNSKALASLNAMKGAIASGAADSWVYLLKCALPLYSKYPGKSPSGRLLISSVLIGTFVDPLINTGIKIDANYKKLIDKWNLTYKKALHYSNVNNPAAAKKATAELLELKANKPWAVLLNSDDIMATYLTKQKEQINYLLNKTGETVKTGIVWGGAALNLWNVMETEIPSEFNLSFKKNSESAKQTYAYLSNMGYLGQSITVLFSSAEDNLFKMVKETASINKGKSFYKVIVGSQIDGKALLKISLNEAKFAYGDDVGKALFKNLEKFRAFIGVLGVFTVIATTFEIVPLYHQLTSPDKQRLNNMEYGLTVIKATAVGVQLLGGGYGLLLWLELIAGFAWAGPVMAIAGIVYLAVTLALFYYSRTDIDLWLANCRFGIKPNNKWLNAPLLELQKLQDVLLVPSVYTKSSIVLTGPKTVAEAEDLANYQMHTTGAWLLLYLPGSRWSLDIAEINIDKCINNEKLINSRPRYLTKEQYESIQKNGFPNSFSDPLDGGLSSENSGLYLFGLPLENNDAEFLIRLQQENSDKSRVYKITANTLKGKVLQETTLPFPEWSGHSMSMIPIS